MLAICHFRLNIFSLIDVTVAPQRAVSLSMCKIHFVKRVENTKRQNHDVSETRYVAVGAAAMHHIGTIESSLSRVVSSDGSGAESRSVSVSTRSRVWSVHCPVAKHSAVPHQSN